MKKQIERKPVVGLVRIMYVFVVPVVFMLSLYLCLFLALNSRQGAHEALEYINAVLPGEIEAERLEVAANLTAVIVHGVRVRDLDGLTVIEAERVGCRLDLSQLLNRQIRLSPCRASDGQVLVHDRGDGSIGIVEAFTGAFRDRTVSRGQGLSVQLPEITIRNMDLLINTPDLAMWFEDINVDGGVVTVAGGEFGVSGREFSWSGGRLVASERLLSLGSGRHGWQAAAWEILRQNRPWSAMRDGPQVPPTEGLLDLPLGDGTLEGMRLVEGGFAFDAMTTELVDGTVSASGWVGLLPESPRRPRTEAPGIRFDGEASLQLGRDLRMFEFIAPGLFELETEGDISPVNLLAHGNLRYADGQTLLAFTHARVAGVPIDRLQTPVSLRNRVVTLGPGEADLLGGYVEFSGTLSTETGEYELGLCVNGVRPGQIIAANEADLPDALLFAFSTASEDCAADLAPGMRIVGTITMKKLSITPARWTPDDKPLMPAVAVIVANNLRVDWDSPPEGIPHGTARVSVRATVLPDGTIVFVDDGGIDIRADGDRIALRGAFDADAMQLLPTEVQLELADLRTWAESEAIPPNLHVRLRTSVFGPVDALQLGDGTLNLRNPARHGTIPDFTATIPFETVGGEVVVRNIDVDSSVGGATVDGRIDLFEGSLTQIRARPSVDLDVEVVGLSLDLLLNREDIAGQADASVHISGPLDDPYITTEFVAYDGRVQDMPIDIFQGSVTVADRVVDITDAFVVIGKGELVGTATYDLRTRLLDADVVGSRFDMAELAHLAPGNLPLEGTLQFDLEASGEPGCGMDISGGATIEELQFAGRDLRSLSFAFDTFDDIVQGAGVLAADINLETRMPLCGGDATILARFQDLRLEDHLPSVADAIDRSALTGELRVDLGMQDQQYRAALQLDEVVLDIGERSFDMPQRASIVWEADGSGDEMTSQLWVQNFALGSDDRYLSIDGGITDLDTLDLTVSGMLDVSLLRFLPALVVDAEGVASVGISLSGPVSDPDFSGNVAFSGVRIAPRGLGTIVALDDGQLSIGGGVVTISRDTPLVGSVYDGDFVAWGNIGLDGVVPQSLDLRFEFANLAYSVPDQLAILLTGRRMRIIAPNLPEQEPWSLEGELEIVDGRFYRDFDLLSGSVLGSRTLQQFNLPIWQQVALIRDMRVNLEVYGRDSFYFESTIADADMELEFRTDLQLTGTFGEMNLQGAMDTLEGSTVFYRGREFEVERMLLTFDGYLDEEGFPWPLIDAELVDEIRPCGSEGQDSFDPSTDLRAIEENVVRVLARVEGRVPLAIAFALEATPFHDQRDILSLILTGCTVDSLTASSAGAPTLEIVLRPFIDLVESNVEERFNVDEVSIIPNPEGSAQIIVQDELSERVTYTVEAIIGGEGGSEQSFTGEWRILQWLSLELREQTDQDGESGIGTGFRFRLDLD